MSLRTVFLLLTIPLAYSAGFTAQADCMVSTGGNTDEDHGTLYCFAGPLPVPGSGYSKTSMIDNKVFATQVGSDGVSFFELSVDKLMRSVGSNYRSFYSLIQYQQTLTTSGPARPGIISYSLEPGPFANAGSEAFDYQQWNIGPYSGSSVGRSNNYLGAGAFILPFALGTPFGISMSSEAFDAGDTATVYGLSYLRFRLYEADGITPVQIVNTPEPATGLITGLAACCLVALARSSKRKR